MKLGQLLSMEGEHLLPREFSAALALLRDSADIMPPAQLRRILGREYGKGWESRFESFDFEPDAAASIGQVHHAIARDGREMALKIQYPGVARSISSDVDNLGALLRASRLVPRGVDMAPLMREAKRQLRQEADYLLEADYLERYGERLADEPGFRVPALHRDFTTRRILAMDYAPGLPLEHLFSFLLFYSCLILLIFLSFLFYLIFFLLFTLSSFFYLLLSLLLHRLALML